MNTLDSRQPLITVVICTYNRYNVLETCLRSFEIQSLAQDEFEVVIVDNSEDEVGQKRFWSGLELSSNWSLIIEKTPGLSRARNIGLNVARGPLVCFIDDDALAPSEWLAEIVDVFATRPECGIAGGPVVPIWPVSRPQWLHKWQEGFLSIVDLGKSLRPLSDSEWLAGTNIAFRRDLLVQVGGFSEALGRVKGTLLSNEELVVSRKIHELGYKSYYSPSARVSHRVHADRVSQAWMRQRAAWQAVSDLMAGNGAGRDQKELWSDVGNYLMSLEPEMRGLRGLFLDTMDSTLFHKQCDAVGSLLHLLLRAAGDPDPGP